MNLPWWTKTLACPNCRSPLHDLSFCGECKTVYEIRDDLPSLMNAEMTCEVKFQYAPRKHAVADQLARALAEPLRYEGRDALPYHLDSAHARCIANQPPGRSVLEIGCGGGQNRHWFEGKGHRYVGTDVSRTRVFDWLQKYGGADLLCDAHFLPFQDQQFDIVYTAATVEHLACPLLALKEMFRVLKPGGYLLSNVSFLEAWHDDSYFHMSPLGVCELLADAGFTVENVWPGRRYSGFTAIPSMGFRGPFKLLRYVGRGLHGMYRLQCWMRNRLRGFRGLPLESSIRQQAVVAGAIDWIARREGASP